MNIDDLAIEIDDWAQAKGWNDRPRTVAEWIALAHTELSEAYEAYRLGHMQEWYDSDRSVEIAPNGQGTILSGYEPLTIPKPEGYFYELADCIIRILHNFREAPHPPSFYLEQKMIYNSGRPYRHGDKIA